MRGHRRTRWSRGHDERGATFILVAICMVLLLWGGAFGVDLGLTVASTRQTQAIADTAALDMARYIGISESSVTYNTVALAANFLNLKLPYATTDNGSGATLTYTTGVWRNGSFTASGTAADGDTSGCHYYHPPATYPCNAVEVTAKQSVPQIFVGGHSSVSRTAIGAVTPEAGFSIGSFLASVGTQQSTVLNALLGTLVDSASVNVTAGGYDGLANTYVSVNQLIAASEGQLTTSNVMTTSLAASQWLTFWGNAVANQAAPLNCSATPTPLPCSASTGLSALGTNGTATVQLCQLVSINGSTCSSINSSSTLSTAALTTNLNVLQMLTTEAEVANGTNAIDLGTSLGITGVSDAKLTLDLLQIPQVAFGPVGTTATTAQVSSDLQLSVLGVSGVLDIPLSAASGTATLETVQCNNNSLSAADIQPATTTATGTVTLAGVTLTTATVSGYSGSEFGYGPSVVPPTATTAADDQNPITAAPTNPNPTFSPTIGSSSPVYAVMNAVQSALGPILQAAGVAIGGAEVADLSTNCGAVSLVQ